MYSDMENEQTIFKQYSKAKNIMQFHSLEFFFFFGNIFTFSMNTRFENTRFNIFESSVFV